MYISYFEKQVKICMLAWRAFTYTVNMQAKFLTIAMHALMVRAGEVSVATIDSA